MPRSLGGWVARGIRTSVLMFAVLVGAILVCVREWPTLGLVYGISVVAVWLGIVGGGVQAIRQEHAHHPTVGAGMCHPDRTDLTVFLALAGTTTSLCAAFWVGPVGHLLLLVGAFLGVWMGSDTVLSLVLLLGVPLLTGLLGGAWLLWEGAPEGLLGQGLRLEVACLGLLWAAATFKSLIRFSGPPGFLRLYLLLALSVAVPLVLGFITVPEEAAATGIFLWPLPLTGLWYAFGRNLGKASSEPTVTGVVLTGVAALALSWGLGSLGCWLAKEIPRLIQGLLLLTILGGCALVARPLDRGLRQRYGTAP